MELRRRRSSAASQHMTNAASDSVLTRTRRTSKSGSATSKSPASVAASSRSGSSRRSSLNDQVNSAPNNDNDGERYPKRRRTSNKSTSTPNRTPQSSQNSSNRSRKSMRNGGKHLPSIDETPAPVRRSKRLSDSTQENISVGVPPDFGTSFDEPMDLQEDDEIEHEDQRNQQRNFDDIADQAVQARSADEPLHITDSVKDAETNTISADAGDSPSSPRQNDQAEHANGVDQAEHFHPRRSQRLSNSSGSLSNEDLAMNGSAESIPKVSAESIPKVTATFATAAEAIADRVAITSSAEDDEPVDNQSNTGEKDRQSSPDQDHLGMSQQSAVQEDGDDDVEAVKSAASGADEKLVHDPAKPLRKLPGRRRQQHAILKVEAALRRQLELKVAYRQLVRSLRPVLIEISKRTLNQLETEPEAYKQALEYEKVQLELKDRFEDRLSHLACEHDYNKKKLEFTLAEELDFRQMRYEAELEKIRDDMLVNLQHDFLMAVRKNHNTDDGDASDDEGEDVIPALRQVSLPRRLGHVLGPQYHSRSRPALETARLLDELEFRIEFHQALRDFDPDAEDLESRPFTTLDPTHRFGVAHDRKMKALMEVLDQASKAPPTPPRPSIPTLPNHQAHALQALAEASVVQQLSPATVLKASEQPPVAQTMNGIPPLVTTTAPREPHVSHSTILDNPQTNARKPLSPESILLPRNGPIFDPFRRTPAQQSSPFGTRALTGPDVAPTRHDPFMRLNQPRTTAAPHVGEEFRVPHSHSASSSHGVQTPATISSQDKARKPDPRGIKEATAPARDLPTVAKPPSTNHNANDLKAVAVKHQGADDFKPLSKPANLFMQPREDLIDKGQGQAIYSQHKYIDDRPGRRLSQEKQPPTHVATSEPRRQLENPFSRHRSVSDTFGPPLPSIRPSEHPAANPSPAQPLLLPKTVWGQDRFHDSTRRSTISTGPPQHNAGSPTERYHPQDLRTLRSPFTDMHAGSRVSDHNARNKHSAPLLPRPPPGPESLDLGPHHAPYRPSLENPFRAGRQSLAPPPPPPPSSTQPTPPSIGYPLPPGFPRGPPPPPGPPPSTKPPPFTTGQHYGGQHIPPPHSMPPYSNAPGYTTPATGSSQPSASNFIHVQYQPGDQRQRWNKAINEDDRFQHYQGPKKKPSQ